MTTPALTLLDDIAHDVAAGDLTPAQALAEVRAHGLTPDSLLEPGDRLTLACKREWQYAGEDGWSCNYVHRGGTS